MHPTFLVIEEVVKDSFTTRLMDQAFSVVLLVLFAIYSLRRQKLIEDKLEKYMSEDREEMKEVISNNTRAFERIATKLSVLVLSLSLLLPSCVTRKVTTSVTQKDSTAVTLTSKTNKNAFVFREINTRDTALKLPYRSVLGTLSLNDLKPLHDIDGVAVANVKTFRGQNITGTVSAQPDGQVNFKCEADSLTVIINNLTTQKDSVAFLLNLTEQYAVTELAKKEVEKEIVRTDTIHYVIGWFIILAFSGAILYFIVYLIRKR